MQFSEAALSLGMVEKEPTLGKTSVSTLYFVLTYLEGINTLKTLNFFDVENKKKIEVLNF